MVGKLRKYKYNASSEAQSAKKHLVFLVYTHYFHGVLLVGLTVFLPTVPIYQPVKLRDS